MKKTTLIIALIGGATQLVFAGHSLLVDDGGFILTDPGFSTTNRLLTVDEDNEVDNFDFPYLLLNADGTVKDPANFFSVNGVATTNINYIDGHTDNTYDFGTTQYLYEGEKAVSYTVSTNISSVVTNYSDLAFVTANDASNCWANVAIDNNGFLYWLYNVPYDYENERYLYDITTNTVDWGNGTVHLTQAMSWERDNDNWSSGILTHTWTNAIGNFHLILNNFEADFSPTAFPTNNARVFCNSTLTSNSITISDNTNDFFNVTFNESHSVITNWSYTTNITYSPLVTEEDLTSATNGLASISYVDSEIILATNGLANISYVDSEIISATNGILKAGDDIYFTGSNTFDEIYVKIINTTTNVTAPVTNHFDGINLAFSIPTEFYSANEFISSTQREGFAPLDWYSWDEDGFNSYVDLEVGDYPMFTLQILDGDYLAFDTTWEDGGGGYAYMYPFVSNSIPYIRVDNGTSINIFNIMESGGFKDSANGGTYRVNLNSTEGVVVVDASKFDIHSVVNGIHRWTKTGDVNDYVDITPSFNITAGSTNIINTAEYVLLSDEIKDVRVELSQKADVLIQSYGGICVQEGVTAQSIASGTNNVVLIGFNGNSVVTNTIADYANNKITITQVGVYVLSCNMSFKGASAVWTAGVFVGGIETDAKGIRTISTATDNGSMGFTTFVNVDAVPVDVDVRVRHDAGVSKDVTPTQVNLNVLRIGN